MPRVSPPADIRPTQIVETPIDSSLAERLLQQLANLSNTTKDETFWIDPDAALEAINLAFLEARADVVLHSCTPLLLTGVEPRFTGQTPAGGSETLLGPLPPVGTLWISPQGQKFFIASHKEV
jgi:hypothetical protein